MSDFSALVIRAQVAQPGVTVTLQAQADGNSWATVRSEIPWNELPQTEAGRCLALTDAPASAPVFDRIRLLWRGATGGSITVQAVTIYPKGFPRS